MLVRRRPQTLAMLVALVVVAACGGTSTGPSAAPPTSAVTAAGHDRAGFDAASLSAQPEPSDRPKPQGQIVFEDSGQDFQHSQIWLENADGSNVRQVVSDDFTDNSASLSPDGKRIVFYRAVHGFGRGGGRRPEPVRDADDREHRRLGPPRDRHGGPREAAATWHRRATPGRRTAARIAYVRYCFDKQAQPVEAGVWTIKADGTDARQVTRTLPDSNVQDHRVGWSPDGKSLTFERIDTSTTPERAALFTIGVDGKDLFQVTPWSVDGNDPDWSPDGSLIVFNASAEPSPTQNIWTIHPDGTGLTQLTTYDQARPGDVPSDMVAGRRPDPVLAQPVDRRLGRLLRHEPRRHRPARAREDRDAREPRPVGPDRGAVTISLRSAGRAAGPSAGRRSSGQGGRPLVLAHDADAPEAHLLVGADRASVGGVGVDDDPVVPAIVEQVPGEDADRLGPDAAPVDVGVQHEVDARVAVHRVGLLVRLDQPDDPAVELDHPDVHAGIAVLEEVRDLGVVRRGPPAGDLSRGEDGAQLPIVVGTAGAEDDAWAAEGGERARLVGRRHVRIVRGRDAAATAHSLGCARALRTAFWSHRLGDGNRAWTRSRPRSCTPNAVPARVVAEIARTRHFGPVETSSPRAPHACDRGAAMSCAASSHGLPIRGEPSRPRRPNPRDLHDGGTDRRDGEPGRAQEAAAKSPGASVSCSSFSR